MLYRMPQPTPWEPKEHFYPDITMDLILRESPASKEIAGRLFDTTKELWTHDRLKSACEHLWTAEHYRGINPYLTEVQKAGDYGRLDAIIENYDYLENHDLTLLRKAASVIESNARRPTVYVKVRDADIPLSHFYNLLDANTLLQFEQAQIILFNEIKEKVIEKSGKKKTT